MSTHNQCFPGEIKNDIHTLLVETRAMSRVKLFG